MNSYSQQSDPILNQRYHLNNLSGFMNDVQAIFQDKFGRYHVYYLNDPCDGLNEEHGNSGWQHAVSDNLIDWKNNLELSINPQSMDSDVPWGTVASGSLVQSDGTIVGVKEGDLVAYFTSYGAPNCGNQSIWMAVSSDEGETFQATETSSIHRNVDDFPNFRDPYVFKNGQYWMMYLAEGQKIGIYRSHDGIDFTYVNQVFLDSGQFPNGKDYGIIECPVLHELIADDGTRHALLFFGNNDYHDNHGTGTSYLLGQLDDGIFVGDYFLQEPIRIDYGTDYYGANFGYTLDRQLLTTAWINSWNYANAEIMGLNNQETFHKGSLATIRKLDLIKNSDNNYQLQVVPVEYQVRNVKYLKQELIDDNHVLAHAGSDGEIVTYSIYNNPRKQLVGQIDFDFVQNNSEVTLTIDFDQGTVHHHRLSNLIQSEKYQYNYSNIGIKPQKIIELLNSTKINVQFMIDTNSIELYFCDIKKTYTIMKLNSIFDDDMLIKMKSKGGEFLIDSTYQKVIMSK